MVGSAASKLRPKEADGRRGGGREPPPYGETEFPDFVARWNREQDRGTPALHAEIAAWL